MFAVQLLFSGQHNHVFKVFNERFKYRNLEELDLLSAFCCYMWYYFVTCRKKQVHRQTVSKFPGNNIPFIRGNPVAKRQFEEVVNECKHLINTDIGYDEGKVYNM